MLIAPIIPPTDPISFGVDIIITVLGVLFGSLFGGGGDATEAQLTQLRDSVATAIDWVKRFAWAVAAALGALLQAIQKLFIDLLDKLKALLQEVAKAVSWVIHCAIPAILKAIRQLRKWLAMVYQKYIRPVLIYLQLVRRYLAILRLLHVHIAAKLDGFLGQIQGWITLPFFYALRSINAIGSWINLIVTANGVIQRGVFINSMYAYQGDWIPMWWTGQSPNGGNGVAPPAPPAFVPPTSSQVADGVGQAVSTNTGEYANYGALTIAAFNEASSGAPIAS